MATVHVDGATLQYETAGAGPTVALVPDLGLGAWSWAWVHGDLAGPRESLVYDPRGAGPDGGADDGPYTVERHGRDLRAVLEDHGADRVHLVGAGVGGLVALVCAAHVGRVATLTLVGAPRDGFDPPAGVRESLLSADAATSLAPHVGEAFLDTPAGDRAREWHDAESAPPAVRRETLDNAASFALDAPHEQTLPTLVLHGDDDAVVPSASGSALADALPRGSFTAVADAPHLLPVAAPRALTDSLAAFLDDEDPAAGV